MLDTSLPISNASSSSSFTLTSTSSGGATPTPGSLSLKSIPPNSDPLATSSMDDSTQSQNEVPRRSGGGSSTVRGFNGRQEDEVDNSTTVAGNSTRRSNARDANGISPATTASSSGRPIRGLSGRPGGTGAGAAGGGGAASSSGGGAVDLADAWIGLKRKNHNESLRGRGSSREARSTSASASSSAIAGVSQPSASSRTPGNWQNRNNETNGSRQSSSHSGMIKRSGSPLPSRPLSPNGSSMGSGGIANVSGPRRHLAQQDRVYPPPHRRYDADFDRSLPSAGTGSSAGTGRISGISSGVTSSTTATTAASANSKILYNPWLDKKTSVQAPQKSAREVPPEIRNRKERFPGGREHDTERDGDRDRDQSGIGNGPNPRSIRAPKAPKLKMRSDRERLDDVTDDDSVMTEGNSPPSPAGRNEFSPSKPTAPVPVSPRPPGRRERRERERARERNPRGTSDTSGKIRQLFDPYRDDPVRFSAKRGPNKDQPTDTNNDENTAGITVNPDPSSTINSIVDGKDSRKDRKKRGDGSSRGSRSRGNGGKGAPAVDEDDPDADAPGVVDGGESDRRAGDLNPFIHHLRAAMKDIVALENKLRDEHQRAAVMAEAAANGRAFGGDEGPVGGNKGVVAGMLSANGVVKRLDGKQTVYDDEYWVRLRSGHERLADAHVEFMKMALHPTVPASHHSIPQKYSIPSRLWENAFHQLLERMRHAIPPPGQEYPGGADILEHFTDFIYHAYRMLTSILDEVELSVFRNIWLEQLGDIARYRMLAAGIAARHSAYAANQAAKANGLDLPKAPTDEKKSDDDEQRSREGASIGEAALGDWELEEQETWRATARSWYGLGLKETPGTGRLHHHLALLSRGDELRALYHYSRSLTASHPYLSTKESILPLFDHEVQARRTHADVAKTDLFVHLHGMLFTNINLDDFDDVLARLMEKLEEDHLLIIKKDREVLPPDWQPLSEVEWIMTAVINVCALMQYGSSDGVLKRAMTKEAPPPKSEKASHSSTGHNFAPSAIIMNSSALKRPHSGNDSGDGGIEGVGSDDPESVGSGDGLAGASPPKPSNGDIVRRLGPTPSGDPASEPPTAFRLAQTLTFGMLSFVLKHAARPIGSSTVVNPYVTTILTFISHLAKFPNALNLIERQIPWVAITEFLNTQLPPTVDLRVDAADKLLGAPLPEDWCIRGMEWVGKTLFGRGYWRNRAGQAPKETDVQSGIAPSNDSEMDVLAFEGDRDWDEGGVIEIADADDPSNSPLLELASSRWKRVATCSAWLAKAVPGLVVDSSKGKSGKIVILASLEKKMKRWAEEKRKEAEEKAQRAPLFDDYEDEEGAPFADEEEEDLDAEDDSDMVKELKARRRELKAIIRASRESHAPLPRRMPRAAGKVKPSLLALPGYTTFVFDTNILLSSLKLFRSLLESSKWTMVVPLAVIIELDGLKKNTTPLGKAADQAITYLEVSVKPRRMNLKIQTSRGNYLADLTFRTENLDFGPSDSTIDRARNMDDLILRSVTWNLEHWSNRLILTSGSSRQHRAPAIPEGTSKVALVTFDRNLRLKARARGLDVADEKDMARLLESVQQNPSDAKQPGEKG